MSRFTITKLLPTLMAVALLAACGSDSAAPAKTASSGAISSGSAQTGSAAALAPMSKRTRLKVALNGVLIGQQLPYFLAIDSGYFEQAGFDVEVVNYTTSTDTLIPQAATGDIDVLPLTAGPALFNQKAQGFDLAIISAGPEGKAGRYQFGWLVVRQDLASDITKLADLKGRTIDASGPGSPPDLIANLAAQSAQLQVGKDVTITYAAKSPADYITLFQNKAADVIPTSEPSATKLEAQGVGKKWLSYSDVAPYYQVGFIGASGKFIQNTEAVQKFLEVWLYAAREINAANGEWTPALLQLAQKWSQLPPETITAAGGVPFFDPNGELDSSGIDKIEDFWVSAGQVKTRINLTDLVNTGPLDAAVKTIGKAS